MRKLARFGSLLLGLSACSTHLEYSGSVVDESGQPIRSALVTLEKDGTVVATDTAGKDGQFNVGTTEPAGFGCGILSDGYKLTVRRDGDASAAFAELHGRQFANLGSVKLLDQSLAVELQEGTVLMTTTSTAVLIDDGLTWDVPGAGAMPIEALGRSGKHTFRRTETQPVGTGGELKVARQTLFGLCQLLAGLGECLVEVICAGVGSCVLHFRLTEPLGDVGERCGHAHHVLADIGELLIAYPNLCV